MASRSQASTQARRQAQMDALDALGSNRSEFNTAGAMNVVENLCANFIERVKTNIHNTKDFIVTGEIEDIRLDVSDDKVDIIIPNHLLFQDLGVNGSFIKNYDTPFTYRDLRPPVDVFINYIKTKNLQLRNEENMGGNPSKFEDLSEDDLVERAAWGMSTNIWKKGFKPRSIYSKEIPQLIEDIKTNVANYTVNFLKQIIVNNDGTRSNIPLK